VVAGVGVADVAMDAGMGASGDRSRAWRRQQWRLHRRQQFLVSKNQPGGISLARQPDTSRSFFRENRSPSTVDWRSQS